MKILFPGLIVLLLCFGIKTGFCNDQKDERNVYAVQERLFHRSHELGFSLGYIPDDDFSEVYPIGLSYTYHFNYTYAWEVARMEYMATQEKEIKEKLVTRYGVAISEFPEPKYMVHTNFVIKPLYGKQSIWNQDIVNNESYLFIGNGIIKYERYYFEEGSEMETVMSLDFGFGIKFYLNKSLCLNIEIRDLITFKEISDLIAYKNEKIENYTFIGLSLGYRFNFRPRKTEKDRIIETLKKYLNKDEKK